MKTTIFETAKWIWPDSQNWDIHNSYALFRKEIELGKLPRRAPLYISADQSYQLYINGSYVCRGPARGYQSHWPYDEVDVRPWLRAGRNVLAVRAHNPGFSNFQYLTQGYAGMLVAGRWAGASVHSDATWKCRRQTGINPSTVPTSLQLFCQEHIDLRVEDPRWMQPDFDDSGWNSPVASCEWNGMPWYSLEERGIPLLEESAWERPVLGAGIAEGVSASGYRTTRDITRLRHSEGLDHTREEFSAESLPVKKTKPGRFRSFLLDFGTTVVGSVGFDVSGAAGGEILDTLHVETIQAATGTPDFRPDVHCRMAFGHRMVCRAGDQSHTFYHGFGFRYMVLTVRDAPAGLTIRPHLRKAIYPMERNGSFQSSDPVLERIWETCAWTQRVCSLDAYVDTPWREQAQWWGDARVQAKNTFFYSGDPRLLRRGIAQIAGQTAPNGLTYGHAPTMAHSCILPDFTLIWMITLWDYYWQTGSLEPFLAHQETLCGALDYFEQATDAKTGLLSHDKRYWLFLDWADLFRDGCSAVYNFWLLIALEMMVKLSREAGMPDQASRFGAWARRLRKALGALQRKDGLVSDGLTMAGKLVKETSVHAQTLAMLANFHPEQNARRLEKVLLPFIRGETKPKAVPDSYWINYVFEALTAAGHGTEVIRCIRKKWAPMIGHGTTWEGFSPTPGDASHSHAWSAHPLYHLIQTLGGVRQAAPGWKRIVFEPVFEGKSGGAVVPTPLGPIKSSWEKSAVGIGVSLELPEGVEAEVRLPDRKLRHVRGINNWKVPARASGLRKA